MLTRGNKFESKSKPIAKSAASAAIVGALRRRWVPRTATRLFVREVLTLIHWCLFPHFSRLLPFVYTFLIDGPLDCGSTLGGISCAGLVDWETLTSTFYWCDCYLPDFF